MSTPPYALPHHAVADLPLPLPPRRGDLRLWSDWRHSALPLLLLGGLSLWLIGAGGDHWLAQGLFQAEGGQWALKHRWLTEALLHPGQRWLSGLAWFGLLLALALSYRKPALRHWRPTLVYLLLAVTLSVGLVSALKRSLLSDCPWDMQGFGGERPALSVFDPRPSTLPPAHCFPAGHASAGYAWLALYFAAAAAGRWRRRALATGLGLGLLMGLTQQLRGAHFASHDLWTAAICWYSALALSPLLPRRGEVERP